MIREQKQIQDFQAQKMVSNQLFEKKIEKLIQENEQLSLKNQQLMEKSEEDQQAYVCLLQEKQQIVQDLELSEEMKIHWENMYQNEHKRYRFNYELVQDQLDEIQKLKEQIENNEKNEKQTNQSKPFQNSQNSKLFQRKPLMSSINRSLNSSTLSEKNNSITGEKY
ncbi:hypothetical protein PPERSA_02915 [Pseudocohnilembus persalinus]|uniref:Uncharacterized protein n=1 Tax=Pseudocohnilembus persalinus TaxID=266149 RepID=A0A0V0QNK4_PSEPJ|nr:hypothetical protein PPERSA_02915 [Pseudocohnilembus persalinus]|eukprot:KRX03536.1 hypothetical protein PPERSA_02915 [Pseudocohnilembus persalinus]